MNITAAIYSFTTFGVVVEWYLDDVLLDPSNDPRYSSVVGGASSASISVHVLRVVSVAGDTVGQYRAVITVGDRNQSDSVLLAFLGELKS